MMLIQSLIFVTRTNFFQMLTTVNSSFCQVSRELAAKECELRYATDNVERAKLASLSVLILCMPAVSFTTIFGIP